MISQLLIILRVAQGRALSRSMVNDTLHTGGASTTALHFNTSRSNNNTYTSATINLSQQGSMGEAKASMQQLGAPVARGQTLEMVDFGSKDESNSAHDAV